MARVKENILKKIGRESTNRIRDLIHCIPGKKGFVTRNSREGEQSDGRGGECRRSDAPPIKEIPRRATIRKGEDLLQTLRDGGHTPTEIAEALGYGHQYIKRVMQGSMPLSKAVSKEIEKFLANPKGYQ